MSGGPRVSYVAALTELLRREGHSVEIDLSGAVTLPVGRADVVLEWVEQGDHLAVYAVVVGPGVLETEEMGARRLLQAHFGGAGTRGCAFWMLPDGTLMAGLTLVGPRFDADGLEEAVLRVGAVAIAEE